MKIIDNIKYYNKIEIINNFDIKNNTLLGYILKKQLQKHHIDHKIHFYSEIDILYCLKHYPVKKSLWSTEYAIKYIDDKFKGNIKLLADFHFTKVNDSMQANCRFHGVFKTTIQLLSIAEYGCKACGKLISNQKMCKTKSKTFEEFEIQAKIKHNNKFTYLKETYKNLTTHMTAICPTHNHITIKPRTHLKGVGCKKCSQNILTDNMNKTKRITQKEFIKRCQNNHKNFYDYTKTIFFTTAKNISVICPIHGEFTTNASHHMRGHGCSKCGFEKVSKNNILSRPEFLHRCNKTHGFKYDYSKFVYVNYETPGLVTCPIHGEFSQSPDKHLHSIGCMACGMTSMRNAQRSNKEEFIEKAKKIHANKYSYDNISYINCDTKIEIMCNKHNKVFSQTPYCHLNGAGCPRCYGRISAKEERWLDYMNIPNTKENRQVKINLPNGKHISADGFMPNTNTIYLFHGDYFHGNPTCYHPERMNVRCNKTYGELFKITTQKEEMIKNAGFNLITIWESDFKNIDKEILKNRIELINGNHL